jgi:hypothetical protein
MCDWCGTIHAGDASNCPGSGQTRETYDIFGADFSDDADPTIEPLCDEVLRRVRSITEYIRKFNNGDHMLPTADQEQKQTRRTGKGIPYVTTEDLSRSAKEAKIMDVRADNENKFGPRIILKIAMDGKTWFFGVNLKKNPNYKILLDKFGREENDWVGQKILLSLEQDEFTENYYARVTFPTGGKGK